MKEGVVREKGLIIRFSKNVVSVTVKLQGIVVDFRAIFRNTWPTVLNSNNVQVDVIKEDSINGVPAVNNVEAAFDITTV